MRPGVIGTSNGKDVGAGVVLSRLNAEEDVGGSVQAATRPVYLLGVAIWSQMHEARVRPPIRSIRLAGRLSARTNE